MTMGWHREHARKALRMAMAAPLGAADGPARPCRRPADLVRREFTRQRPDACWVADYTHVATWSETVYVAFVLDVHSGRILGWRAATCMHTALVLNALEQAIWTGGQAGPPDWPARPLCDLPSQMRR